MANLSLLVVDDSKAMQSMIADHLRGLPLELHSALTFDEALQALETRQPDFIILDYHLTAGRDATHVCDAITQISPHGIPVIAISGREETIQELNRRYEFVAATIHKSFTREELVAVVTQVMEAIQAAWEKAAEEPPAQDAIAGIPATVPQRPAPSGSPAPAADVLAAVYEAMPRMAASEVTEPPDIAAPSVPAAVAVAPLRAPVAAIAEPSLRQGEGPFIQRQAESRTSTSGILLMRAPLEVLGPPGRAVDFLRSRSLATHTVVLVTLASPEQTIRLWIDRGRIAGYTSTALPPTLRPTGIPADLVAQLISEQALTGTPIFAALSDSRGLDEFQTWLAQEFEVATAGLLNAETAANVPDWCPYPEL